VIAAHGVNSNSDQFAQDARHSKQSAGCGGAQGHKPEIIPTVFLRGSHDFLAAIKPIRRDAMTRVSLARGRIDDKAGPAI